MADVLISDFTCTIFYRKGCGGWGKSGYQKFEGCMITYGITVSEIDIEDSNSALQKLSGLHEHT